MKIIVLIIHLILIYILVNGLKNINKPTSYKEGDLCIIPLINNIELWSPNGSLWGVRDKLDENYVFNTPIKCIDTISISKSIHPIPDSISVSNNYIILFYPRQVDGNKIFEKSWIIWNSLKNDCKIINSSVQYLFFSKQMNFNPKLYHINSSYESLTKNKNNAFPWLKTKTKKESKMIYYILIFILTISLICWWRRLNTKNKV